MGNPAEHIITTLLMDRWYLLEEIYLDPCCIEEQGGRAELRTLCNGSNLDGSLTFAVVTTHQSMVRPLLNRRYMIENDGGKFLLETAAFCRQCGSHTVA